MSRFSNFFEDFGDWASQTGYHAFGLESPEDQKKKEDEAALVAPVIEAPAPMPMPTGPTVQAAKRRSLIAQRRRHGRESTILTGLGTDSDQTLG